MNFLKKIGIKIKLIFLAILSAVGFIFYFSIRSKIRIKDQLDYELSRLRSELELSELKEDSKENLEKISGLKEQEKLIKEKIKFIKRKESSGGDVSLEELDSFFKDRNQDG